MKGHHIWTGIPCNDLSTALAAYQPTPGTTNNTITIRLNANPDGGEMYHQPGTDVIATDRLNPVSTYSTRYNAYRPMGCKVTVTVFSQDNGEAAPEGSVSNVQVATPFMLYGFPFVRYTDAVYGPVFANTWTGDPANGFTADTIPQMKYGFRRISPGLGGKNMIKYSTYWDFSKIVGYTKQQYMAQPELFTCQPDEGPESPQIEICLALALADYTPALARQCTVDIKITQYGRWEGQELHVE